MPLTLPNWTHPHTGEVYTNIHVRIVIDNFFKGRHLSIRYRFFPSNTHATQRYSPLKIYTDHVTSSNPAWDTYFAQAALNPVGKNPHKNAEDYILTLDGTQKGETQGIDFTAAVIT